jgi:DNA-binding CsgD family transcriptional regulator
LRWCLAGIALSEAMRGHPDQAAAAAAEVDQLPVGTMGAYEPDVIERSRAWVSVAAGELSRAREILTAAAANAAAAHLNVAEARLLHDIARLGDPGSVAARLAALAEITDGEFVAALARHAAAMASGRAADLEAAAHAFDGIGAELLAAEACLAAAAAYRAAGLARPASAMARKAAELIAICGDAKTPGLSAGSDAERLTLREREIATMAAAGASSREIAARLFLSVRTVDNHLQNAYSKLGVTSREELAKVLR